MKRGDVVRVDLPQPAGAPGHEQYGPRPAVVAQAVGLDPAGWTVVVVPLTSNMQRLQQPGAIPIRATAENGLSVDSVALVGQLRAVDARRIKHVLGSLDAADLAQLEDAMRQFLGL